MTRRICIFRIIIADWNCESVHHMSMRMMEMIPSQGLFWGVRKWVAGPWHPGSLSWAL